MFIGKRMFQFQESKLLNEIAGLPDILKDRDLYNGKKFVNVPDAATPREAVIFKTTGVCKPGILSPDFAKALARAAMVETGVSCGAYGWNTEVCIGEWRCNPVFTKEGGDGAVRRRPRRPVSQCCHYRIRAFPFHLVGLLFGEVRRV